MVTANFDAVRGVDPPNGGPDGARERILAAAYRLFAEYGVRETSVEKLVEGAGVSKASFYKFFTSKDDVALACLEHWHRVESQAMERALARHDGKSEALLAAFDTFAAVPDQSTSELASFLGTMLEAGREHPVGQAIRDHLARRRALLTRLASEAGLADPDRLAWSWSLILEGAIIAAAEGDKNAHDHAKRMAALVLKDQSEDTG